MHFFAYSQHLMGDKEIFMVDYANDMKDRLTKEKEEIMSNLIHENEDFRTAVEDLGVNDLADIASNDLDCQILEAIGHQELKRLNQVDSALARIQNGHYGVCMQCSKMISKDRLDAIPYAVLCIECKSSNEKRNSRK